MTFDHKAYQAYRAAEDGRKTLATRLRDISPDAASAPCQALCREAAAAIEYYEERIKQMRREANEELREADRDARDAYAEGQRSARDDYFPGSY